MSKLSRMLPRNELGYNMYFSPLTSGPCIITFNYQLTCMHVVMVFVCMKKLFKKRINFEKLQNKIIVMNL